MSPARNTNLGQPLSTDPWSVPLGDLTVDSEIIDAARAALASGWWSMGPRVEEFERSFADLCETRHAVAVGSGTAALHLALLAVGCGPGDEVILPSLNFVAAANVIVHTGATPVFCDICGPEDLTLDPADIERAVTPATKAVVVMHYGGFPCDMETISAVTDRHGLTVVEDAAHAPGARIGSRPCGSLGQAGCFSFFSNKNLPVGEGGMVVTDDEDIAARLRLLRSHGMTTLTWDRHRGHAHSYDVAVEGFNYRLDEVRAAIGLVQLSRLETSNEARARAAGRYRDLLQGIDGLLLPFAAERPGTIPAHHLFVVLLPEGTARDDVRTQLRERGVQTSVHYPPIHGFSAYARLARPGSLPQTDALANRLLTLPLFPHISELQLEQVADAIADAVASPRMPATA